ncbi:hypothetical protein LCGC14_2244690, partial [marine sediment metagenome]
MTDVDSTHPLDEPHPMVPRLTRAQVLALDYFLRLKIEVYELASEWITSERVLRHPALARRFMEEHGKEYWFEVEGEALAAVVAYASSEKTTAELLNEVVERLHLRPGAASWRYIGLGAVATTSPPPDFAPKHKIGFKVTAREKSMFLALDLGGLVYKTHSWVFPKENCGPISVFETRALAERWLE